MQALQPKVKELQKKHKGDRETLQKEMMELYKTEKANPLMGCLPMFLQIPVFLGLFHTLRQLVPGRNRHAVRVDRRPVQRAPPTRPCSAFRCRRKFGSTPAELASLERQRHAREDPGRHPGPDHDGDHVRDQPSDDPQDRLGRGPAAEDDPAPDAVRHPAVAAHLRLAVPDRRDHLLGHEQPLHAEPAAVGAPQVPAAADGRQDDPSAPARPAAGREGRAPTARPRTRCSPPVPVACSAARPRPRSRRPRSSTPRRWRPSPVPNR